MHTPLTRLRSFIAPLCATLLLSACASNFGSVESSDANGTVSASPAARVADDFPIPAGSGIVTDQTLILGSGANWTGRLVITLSGDTQSAFVFFRDQGNAFGWELVASSYGKASLLTFSKGQRSATVYIESGFAGPTATVTVSPLAPKGM